MSNTPRLRDRVSAAWRSLVGDTTRAATVGGSTNGDAGWSIVRGQTPSDFQRNGTEVRTAGWERHPVVNACARLVVDLVQSIPLEVYRKRADGTAIVLQQHPALDLLNAPRPGLSGPRLVGKTAMDLFLFGNGFWVLERNGRRGMPRGLRLVGPERVSTAWLNTQNDAIASYDWRDLQGRIHANEPVENVVHFRDLDANDGLFGYPRLASALLDIAADHEASQYVRQIVNNHGAPGMAVMVDGSPTPADLQAGEAKWREKYTTRGMRGMTAFVAGVKGIEQIGFDLQQLEFPDLRRVSREDICAAAGVDPRMIGVASASNDGGLSGEQYREARHRLIQQTVYPLMRVIETELNHWFMPEFGEPLVRFSEEYIAAITEDVTQTSARVVSEVAAKIRTVEEAREAVGLDAEMDPTHTLPGGMTVGDAAANATALGAAAVMAAKAPNDPESDAPPVRAARPPMQVPEHIREKKRLELESEFERVAAALFAAERAAVLKEINAAQGALPDGLADAVLAATLRRINTDYAEGGKFYQAWLARSKDVIGEAVQAGGKPLAQAVGLDFTLQNPRVQGVISRRAADMVQHVTETTRAAIRGAILAGREQNMGVRQIARLIDEATFGEIAGRRARLIAQTETVGALNAGEYTAAAQSGVVRSKTWITQNDPRVRDSHADLDGMTVDMGQSFPNGLRYPHDPNGSPEETIGCRCTLAFSDQEAGRAE